MKLTVKNALSAVREIVENHFHRRESFNGRGEYYYLADTDHETIDEFMEEMRCFFEAKFEED